MADQLGWIPRGEAMSADLQILFSFAATMLGAMLLLTAYFEAGEFELDLEEAEVKSEDEHKAESANHYREL